MATLTLSLLRWRDQARRVDPVWTFLALLLVILGLIDGAQAARSVAFAGNALADIAPFLLLAVGATAGARATGADGLIGRAFTGRLAPMILVAALFGALSPFCSCGVIPLIAALLAIGVPLPAVMAFWLASPLMDPSMFVLTVATLGFHFAVAKTLAAVTVGLLGGYGTWLLARTGALENPLRPEVGDGGCGGSRVRRPTEVLWRFWREPERLATFRSTALDTLLFLGKWLSLAFVLESLMLAWVPQELVATTLGGTGFGAIAVATLVGVPAYLNGYAALPLIGALVDGGMSAGAGMAFLIAGGVTSLPAAIAVWALARPPVFGVYLAFSLTGAMLAGLAYAVVV